MLQNLLKGSVEGSAARPAAAGLSKDHQVYVKLSGFGQHLFLRHTVFQKYDDLHPIVFGNFFTKDLTFFEILQCDVPSHIVLNFDFWSFEFVSNFDIRISDFPVTQRWVKRMNIYGYFRLPF